MTSSGSENFKSLQGSSEDSESSADSEERLMDLTYKNSKWTRVIPGDLDATMDTPLYLIKEDLMLLETCQNTVVRGRPRELKKFFDPEEFTKEHAPLELSERYISAEEFQKYQAQVDNI